MLLSHLSNLVCFYRAATCGIWSYCTVYMWPETLGSVVLGCFFACFPSGVFSLKICIFMIFSGLSCISSEISFKALKLDLCFHGQGGGMWVELLMLLAVIEVGGLLPALNCQKTWVLGKAGIPGSSICLASCKLFISPEGLKLGCLHGLHDSGCGGVHTTAGALAGWAFGLTLSREHSRVFSPKTNAFSLYLLWD